MDLSVDDILVAGGLIAEHLDGYEHRVEQCEMARAVAGAMADGEHLLAEAGTGVGKSFAYLVPAILWAVRNKKRVIVSTNTINLQEQLITKDLPLLEEALDEEFSYALIKGRNNYACRRKTGEVEEDVRAVSESEDDERLLGDLVKWVNATEDGSLADLAMRLTVERRDRSPVRAAARQDGTTGSRS